MVIVEFKLKASLSMENDNHDTFGRDTQTTIHPCFQPLHVRFYHAIGYGLRFITKREPLSQKTITMRSCIKTYSVISAVFTLKASLSAEK